MIIINGKMSFLLIRYTILLKRNGFYPIAFIYNLKFFPLGNDQEVSVVLLDTEGTDSAQGTGFDDHQIFALTVLISSVLIYNTMSVAGRRDLEELEYLLNRPP